MEFIILRPEIRSVPDAELVGLAERHNRHIGEPLQVPVFESELLEQAERDGLTPPLPEGWVFGSADYPMARHELQLLSRCDEAASRRRRRPMARLLARIRRGVAWLLADVVETTPREVNRS